MSARSSNTVNVLWTGGWDSTFRVLSLITTHDCRVQPYYVVDRDRPSWRLELATMARIAEGCRQGLVGAKGEILDLVQVEKDSIEPDAEISENFGRLKARGHIGSQYEWLACFGKSAGIESLEICIHKDMRDGFFLAGQMVERSRWPTATFVIDPGSDPALSMFRHFRFPLFGITKREMQRDAEAQGFLDLMRATWFCHHPWRNRTPCGLCVPCQCTVEEGMGWRLGWAGHLRYRTLRPVKAAMPEGLKDLLRPLLHRMRRRELASG